MHLTILIVVLGLFASCVSAQGTPVRATLVSDFGPESIGGSSFELKILSWISEQGPLKVDFTRQHVSLSKAIALLKVIPDACVLNVVKTPKRQETAIYGERPLTVYPPIRLITLAKRNINLPDPFDLYRLSDKHPWVIGTVKSRRYGTKIDTFIDRHGDILYQRPYTSSIKRFIDMLESGRIDGVLEFTRSIEEYLQASDTPNLQLKVTSLVQANKVMFGYLACAKTEQGKKIIETVNSVYQSEDLKKRIIKAHIEYFGDKERRLLLPILEHVFE